MIDNLINEIEQAMLNVLDNEQLSQLRKVLDYTFRNVSVTKKESVHAESNNQRNRRTEYANVKKERAHPQV